VIEDFNDRYTDENANVLMMFDFICRYYEFDSVIVRELLGKKLTSRLRNSLDDMSEKMHIPLRSCRRQVIRSASTSLVHCPASFSTIACKGLFV